mgnify:CR=1 FL=1
MISSVWVEKYRPKEIEDLILSDKNKKIIKACIDKQMIPNMTLHSPTAGVGKTSIAKMLGSKFCDEDEILFINGSLNRNIDTVRNEMTDFVYSATFSGNKKLIIIDEADGINKIAQDSLRGFIEEWSNECSFILTCNDISKIIPALISRCPKVNLTILPEDRKLIAGQIYNRCEHILRDNLIEFESDALKEIIKNYFPDIRQIINMLQRLSLSGKITLDMIKKQDSIKTSDVLRELEYAIIDKDWAKIRIWAHENYNMDNVYNIIYDLLIPKIDISTVPDFIIITGEYSYRSSLTGYSEINLASYLTEVTNRVKLNV